MLRIVAGGKLEASGRCPQYQALLTTISGVSNKSRRAFSSFILNSSPLRKTTRLSAEKTFLATLVAFQLFCLA